MGLDITSYSNLSYVGEHTTDWCDDEDHVEAFAYDSFRDSFRGIPIVRTKRIGGTDFLIGGCYAVTDKTETHGFRAGSYSGYGAWRDNLRAQFNPGQEPSGPFYELIWFADNEGSIGELAAAELLADFRHHAGLYVPGGDRPWWAEKCQDWTRACELAADGGLIRFH
jgi:hypothetical protein